MKYFSFCTRCNKCGLRYKHGRLDNAPAPPRKDTLSQASGSDIFISQFIPRPDLHQSATLTSAPVALAPKDHNLSAEKNRSEPRLQTALPCVHPNGVDISSEDSADEPLSAKRPCSRTSRDAAMALMELNRYARNTSF